VVDDYFIKVHNALFSERFQPRITLLLISVVRAFSLRNKYHLRGFEDEKQAEESSGSFVLSVPFTFRLHGK